MRIGVIGTGTVGQALAAKLAEPGHDVRIGTRDVGALMARTAPDVFGNPPFSVWHLAHPEVVVVPMAEAAAHGELVINATAGTGSLEALRLAGAKHLAGKVLVDVANPLDFSRGMPPSLFVTGTDSLGEQIQREFPDAKVVKTLNTVNYTVMVSPRALGGGDHTMFVCGDDPGAKATVVDLLHGMGWTDVIDVGDITGARATEVLVLPWLRLFGTFKTPAVTFKVVR